jgi:tetratricopeptide (TPR) repeat protein
MIPAGRYTSGRIAVANLSTSIETLELRLAEGAKGDHLFALSKLLFLRGDVLGRIADHDRAELIANEAIAMSPATTRALYVRAQLAGRFHRFEEAYALLHQSLEAGHPLREIDLERAALLQATGRYEERWFAELAKDDQEFTHLARSHLLAEMGRWGGRIQLRRGGQADDGLSPLPCNQLLFEWGVSAMRRGNLDRADQS